MKFDLPKDQASIIKVIGVGGGGSNAVNHMYEQGISGVDFVICNTDAQALEQSSIPNKIQLGTTLTEGLGAGANPEVGKNAAIEDVEAIKAILQNNTKMVFITAGMGGGTGTGAAPIIAEAAREMGILTVGIVTVPFSFEGRRRKQQADEGLESLRNNVDTLLIINNDKLRMMYGNLKMGEAFAKADDILAVAAKGISEIITVTGYVNTDFRDVQTVMKDGGTAIMGSATAEGENRAIDAVSKALSSPLLNDNEIKGANYILLNITSGTEEITMDEIGDITDYIQDEAGLTADVIWGNCTDESLGGKVAVTVIATGFGSTETTSFDFGKKPEKKVYGLDEDVPTNITQPLEETPEVENTIEEVSNDIEEPFLKIEVEVEQPTLDFEDTPEATTNTFEEETTNLTDNVVEEEQDKVVFSLDDDEAEVEAKRDEMSLNWSEVNDTEIEASTPENNWNEDSIEEVTNEENSWDEPTSETEAPSEEHKTIVWNLNDDDSADEFTSESTDFTPEENMDEEISLSRKDVTSETEQENEGPVYTNRIPDEDQLKRSQERVMKIKELGMKMKTPSGINDLEKEPAYKRRQINLDETPHSSENNISRFTLSEDEEGKPRLNDDNSFLHDNVD
ncbi:MAG: cell division protein FtsZ [Vicingaceae bacterium]|nr:cell division protein FtsZ [Vicingaceae bacterium]